MRSKGAFLGLVARAFDFRGWRAGQHGTATVAEDLKPSRDLPRATMAALMLAAFTVSAGYGVVLPLMPYLIERLLGAGAEIAQVSRHTGLLTAVYTLSPFIFAPLWGRLSDRHGPRRVLLVGLLGFGATMLIFSFVESLVAIYAERFLSGMFAAAVAPVAAAAIGNFSVTEQRRVRRFAIVSMAGMAGFLLGPFLGVFASRLAADTFTFPVSSGSVTIPLAATGLLSLAVAFVAAIGVPSGGGDAGLKATLGVSASQSPRVVLKLLVLTFIVSAGVGAFEVGLALRGRQELGLTPFQVAVMFAECSLVMFLVQAIVFAPWFQPNMTRWLITPALAVLAAGLFLVPHASNFPLMLVVIGAVAAGAGVLLPILTYWISARAGSSQGWELGKQTAAASLGVTVGSAVSGLSYNFAALPGASFVLTAGLSALGLVLSLGLPNLLEPPNSRMRAASA